MPDNFDLKTQVGLNDPDQRNQQRPVGAGRVKAVAGYETLDQAESNEEYGRKERRGLNRTNSYSRRFD